MRVNDAAEYLTGKVENFLFIVGSMRKGLHFKDQLITYNLRRGADFHNELKHWTNITANLMDGGKWFGNARITTYLCQTLKTCGIQGDPLDPNMSCADDWNEKTEFEKAVDEAINKSSEVPPIDKVE